MRYRLLADLVVVAHLVFIVYALLGGLFGLWKKWCLWVHLPAAAWIAIVEFQGWICPLTPLENRLRAVGGALSYEGGFVEHYLIPVIYPPGLTRSAQLMLGGVALAVNVAVYVFVLHRWSRRHRSE
jgi:hypothetical protein